MAAQLAVVAVVDEERRVMDTSQVAVAWRIDKQDANAVGHAQENGRDSSPKS